MPTYTYRCENCDHCFDLHQRFDDPDPTTCLNCGHMNDLHRVYKPVGVVFKGSGFYATDHKSTTRALPNGDKPSKASETKEKSDSKPAAEKSDSKSSSKTKKTD